MLHECHKVSLGACGQEAVVLVDVFSCFLVLLLVCCWVFFLPLPPPIWDKDAGSKCHSTWGDEHGKLQQRG